MKKTGFAFFVLIVVFFLYQLFATNAGQYVQDSLRTGRTGATFRGW